MFTLEEKDAIRFYEGDTRIRNTYGKIINKKSSDHFLKTEKAYKTLNALLFPGISNEKERILQESSQLNRVMPENIDKTINIYCNIYSAMCKSSFLHKDELITYRVERKESLNNLKLGYTNSFTSTSKDWYNKNFSKKNGIVLLEYHIPVNTPFADFQEILGKEYRFKEESEILLPPFVKIMINEGNLSITDKQIKDMQGESPIAKYIVTIEEDDKQKILLTKEKIKRLKEYVYDKDKCLMVGRTLENMNHGMWEENFKDYIVWKQCLQEYLRILFYEIDVNM